MESEAVATDAFFSTNIAHDVLFFFLASDLQAVKGKKKKKTKKQNNYKKKGLAAPKHITFNAHLFWLHNVNKKPFHKRAWEI